MEKIENLELEKEIISLFDSGVKKRKIAKTLDVSTSYIDRIILQKNKPKRIISPDEGFKIIAKCKKTGKFFEDYENKSGVLTNYIINNYSDFILPTSFKRRKFFKENNIFWYEEFFNIIQIPIIKQETKKCNYCEWNTIDLGNESGCYTTHLLKEHGKSIDEYVLEYPEEKKLFKTFFEKKEKKLEIISSSKNHIKCKICGEKMSKITNTHLKYSHNMTLVEYKILHQNTLSETSLNKFKQIYDDNLRELPSKYISKPQKEISDFIEDLGFLIETNNKSILEGIELDIFVKEKNIAFEFNGLYFHSQNSGKKERLYHRNKTNFSNLKGIRLIHIFEDEWQNRKDIIKSKIKHILGVSNSNRIHTRELNIKNITRQEKDSFLELNHIQGSDESNISIGAFLNDKLYAVMSFDNNRSMNKGKDHNSKTYELKRFATDINYIIPGVASRFLKFFIKEFSPKRIISFADLRWTSPEYNLYNKLGFTLYETIHPDYSYTFYKSGVAYRFHKFGFGKKAIKRKFPDIYQDNKTEWEMMQEKGFDRIWDCGKLKYVMNL